MDASSSSRLNSSVPTGLRVLVVDDDNISLFVLKMSLLKCGYHVTTCTQGTKALSLLRENKGAYDIVMLDVHMPGMNGMQVLETIGLEMDIPVLMISGDSSEDAAMEGLMHGACDYLVKPFGAEQVRFVWKHAVQRRIAGRNKRKRDAGDTSDGDDSDNDDYPHRKKTRVWNAELHQKFVEVVKELGIDRAAPKKILEKMDVPGLYKSQVASHLQKFRNLVKKTVAARMPNQIPEEVLDKFSAQTLGSCSNVAELPAGASASAATVSTSSPALDTAREAASDRVPATDEGEPSGARSADRFGSSLSATQLLQLVESNARRGPVLPPAPEAATGTDKPTLDDRGKEVIAEPAGSSPVCSFSDEDEILQEDFLVRLFNSSNDDAFL